MTETTQEAAVSSFSPNLLRYKPEVIPDIAINENKSLVKYSP